MAMPLSLTMDPNILLSVVNMELRDEFSSLEDLCRMHELDEQALKEVLGRLGFTYEPEQNQFR